MINSKFRAHFWVKWLILMFLTVKIKPQQQFDFSVWTNFAFWSICLGTGMWSTLIAELGMNQLRKEFEYQCPRLLENVMKTCYMKEFCSQKKVRWHRFVQLHYSQCDIDLWPRYKGISPSFHVDAIDRQSTGNPILYWDKNIFFFLPD